MPKGHTKWLVFSQTSCQLGSWDGTGIGLEYVAQKGCGVFIFKT